MILNRMILGMLILILTGCCNQAVFNLTPDWCVVDNRCFYPPHTCVGDTGRWINYTHNARDACCPSPCYRYGRVSGMESCRCH